MNASLKVMAPPRLLLGVAFLYWGAVAGHPVVGLGCAFMVEARWWADLRWQFGERGFSRAWKLALLFAVLAIAWFWIQGATVLLVFDLMLWAPVLFLPVLLAQQYSLEERMPISTFSYIAKRKMELDRAAGREVQTFDVHVGYAYFCLVLIGACLGGPGTVVSFVVAVVLGGIGLFFASPLGRMRPVSWMMATTAAVVLAMAGAAGINVLWGFLHGGNLGMSTGQGLGDESHTAIGTLGQIKQSYRIRWRIGMDSKGSESLFQSAGFNHYGHGVWRHRTRADDYGSMASVGAFDGEENRWSFIGEYLGAENEAEESYRVRGAAHPRKPTPIPLLEGARVLVGVETEGGVEYNEFGTVRVVDSMHGVLDFGVSSGEGNVPENEGLPEPEMDLAVPVVEELGLARVCRQLGLAEMSDVEKVVTLRTFFQENFAYSLILSDRVLAGPDAAQAITRFLEQAPIGHCEYFGTATVLLLRQAGVPARYSEGYGAQEWDSGRQEWVLRDAHSHAWCRAYLGGHAEEQLGEDGQARTVWSGGQWVDVDLTPPDWFGREQVGGGAPILTRVLDWWQRFREDLLLWRTRVANKRLVTVVLTVLVGLVLFYVGRRLWKHQTRRERKGRRKSARGEGAVRTPLHALERSVTRILGPRPEGMSLTRWLLLLEEFLPGERDKLVRVVGLHWKARFDPLGAEEGEQEQLDESCRELRLEIKRLRRR